LDKKVWRPLVYITGGTVVQKEHKGTKILATACHRAILNSVASVRTRFVWVLLCQTNRNTYPHQCHAYEKIALLLQFAFWSKPG